jgi:hypothetical protein
MKLWHGIAVGVAMLVIMALVFMAVGTRIHFRRTAAPRQTVASSMHEGRYYEPATSKQYLS